jgi:RNA polymerase sigma-70 factor, ECF subfamily
MSERVISGASRLRRVPDTGSGYLRIGSDLLTQPSVNRYAVAMSASSCSELNTAASAELAAKRAASRQAATEDTELVRRFLTGDAAAFEEIVHRHRDRLYAVVQGLLRNHADAEEIVQDTFVRAHRGLAKFRGDSSLATWLHHVAVNLARNRYWYFHRRKRHDTLSLDCPLSEDGTGTFADLLPSAADGPSRQAITEEFTELVTVCMDQLPAAHREILSLRNTLNRSYAEIAAMLGIEVGTVKSRIARARGQLRSLMAQTCPEFAEDAAPSDWFEPARHQATTLS